MEFHEGGRPPFRVFGECDDVDVVLTVAAFSLMDVRFIFPMSRSLLKIAGFLALFEPVSSVGVLPESCGAGGEIVSVLAGFLSGLLARSCAAGWFEIE